MIHSQKSLQLIGNAYSDNTNGIFLIGLYLPTCTNKTVGLIFSRSYTVGILKLTLLLKYIYHRVSSTTAPQSVQVMWKNTHNCKRTKEKYMSVSLTERIFLKINGLMPNMGCDMHSTNYCDHCNTVMYCHRQANSIKVH